eukprot:Tamp_11613.p1 GENE.Tamp_11613~~Tamp_11613.p1  ORF type:complete len:501 (-),score=113.77 Tamp_11613:395-1858(-)
MRVRPTRARALTSMAQQTELSAATKRALEAIVGEKSATYSQAVREQHCRDESYHADTDGVFPPQAVVFPKSTEEVQEIVKLCARDKIPIVASGACTSLEGHLAALRGGVAINMREMNQVLEVNADDMDVRCQAGVTRKQLNTYIRDTGLMFTVDPGADATLGGMASTRASGTNTVKYGTMRDNVIQLSAVLADGSVIKAGSRARKSSTGYDLKNLLIGSEGTLGIITEVTVRLYGQPEAVSSAVCEFPTLADAVNCTIAIIQMGIPVARIEMMDAMSCKAVNKYSNMTLQELPTLFFEFHGSPASVEEMAQNTGELAESFGASGFKWSSDASERAKLWEARHHAYWAAIAMRGKENLRGMPTDACVPISRLAECVMESDADLRGVTERTGLVGPLVGHVGDGNFHYCLAIDVTNAEEIREAKAFAERLAQRAIRMGGTCSGEHGVGYGKLKFLESEHGAGALSVMRSIKAALDPHNILNPGKIATPQ